MAYLDGKMKKHTLVLALTICPNFNGFGDLCKFSIFFMKNSLTTLIKQKYPCTI